MIVKGTGYQPLKVLHTIVNAIEPDAFVRLSFAGHISAKRMANNLSRIDQVG